MTHLTRRQFGGIVLLGSQAPGLFGASTSIGAIDRTLREGIERRKIPCVAAMVATQDRILYSGSFGKRDSASGIDIQPDSIFQIASMTKAITSVAAMQLVERGKLKLDEPVARHLPELGKLDVIQGFEPNGKPILRPATKAITLRHLLTHTSGFAYPTWSEEMFKYTQATAPLPPGVVAPLVPLVFEPGTRWQYGYSADWTGRLVERVSGLNLEQYFQRNILGPLGMTDTTFIFPAAKFDRLVSQSRRQNGGPLQEVPRAIPPKPAAFNGGGGLTSTAPDYIKFMQMILRYGRGGVRDEILTAKSVEMMSVNQIGDLGAGKLKSFQPDLSSDVDVQPGEVEKWGLGFLINQVAYPGGRSAGSLAWAGVYNTFYWIDPSRGICAVIMMQFLPFVDKEAVGLLGEFERSVYANI
ncbi:MAG TPA: serine hydrolase domain-containing protein [Bryobacteraceae bacterium]|jgi:CubicO group peptidase (beta-lactamase class C family)|nr:serine hydrolase domain-containing protein [Bryobacteraceae bacterium]